MRVLVCGGRGYADSDRVFRCLQALMPSAIIQGGANGADELARDFAQSKGIACETFKAPWSALGRAAGPIRNQRMIDEGKPDLVVAFPGGKGTADMVKRARNAGIQVIEVD